MILEEPKRVWTHNYDIRFVSGCREEGELFSNHNSNKIIINLVCVVLIALYNIQIKLEQFKSV